MSHNHIATLKKKYDGQRIFNAKEDGYSFDVLSDTWEIGYKSYLYLDWMNMLDVDSEAYLDLKLAIAHSAIHYANRTISTFVSSLKTIVTHIDIYDFQAWWLTLDSRKKKVRDCLYALCHPRNNYTCNTLQPLYDVIKNENMGRQVGLKNVLDPKTGAYSEIEHDNILERVRIESSQILKRNIKFTHDFTAFRNIIACQLLLVLIRRPTQLIQIKWCDIIHVGQAFESHKESDIYWIPVSQHLFSDVEQLHIRTFKGKDGQFRGSAESRSHRLESDFSQLLLDYYQVYKNHLVHSLSRQQIILHDDETKELMRRLPVLPDQTLFSLCFESKSDLFGSISDTSMAYHLKADSLNRCIRYLFKHKLRPSSDRLPNDPLILTNNRWRHTILTQGAKHGLSPASLAAITGVTVEAIFPYLDLKASERVKIDEAYAGNNIIQRFDTISVTELQSHDEFKVKSMFDEEIGYKLNPIDCSSCQSKGGAPMACYPCDNFRPLETANHKQYFDKAVRKLSINSQSAHPATVKRLKKIILYIKMTINICEEIKTKKLELRDESN